MYIKATYPIPLIVQELQTPYCPYNIEQAAKTTEKKGAERTSYKTPPSYANTSLSITKDVTLYCKWASLLLLDRSHNLQILSTLKSSPLIGGSWWAEFVNS